MNIYLLASLITLICFVLGFYLGRSVRALNLPLIKKHGLFTTQEDITKELEKTFKVVSPSKKLQAERLARELEQEQSFQDTE